MWETGRCPSVEWKFFSSSPSSLPREGAWLSRGVRMLFTGEKNVLFPNPVSAPMPETPHSNAQYGRLGRRMGSQSRHSQRLFLHVLVHCCPLSAPTVFQTLYTMISPYQSSEELFVGGVIFLVLCWENWPSEMSQFPRGHMEWIVCLWAKHRPVLTSMCLVFPIINTHHF